MAEARFMGMPAREIGNENAILRSFGGCGLEACVGIDQRVLCWNL